MWLVPSYNALVESQHPPPQKTQFSCSSRQTDRPVLSRTWPLQLLYNGCWCRWKYDEGLNESFTLALEDVSIIQVRVRPQVLSHVHIFQPGLDTQCSTPAQFRFKKQKTVYIEREKINQDLSKFMMPNVLEGQEQNSDIKILIRSALTNILNAGLFLVTEYFYTVVLVIILKGIVCKKKKKWRNVHVLITVYFQRVNRL